MSEADDLSDGETLLCQRLRELRGARGWTLEQTGVACDLSGAVVASVEIGEVSPTYNTLIKLANGLEVDLSELLVAEQKPMGAGRRSVCRNNSGFRLDTQSPRPTDGLRAAAL
ncbi:MAG: helix-turn-helix transcriptional regulator [Burkholderiales bacterium]